MKQRWHVLRSEFSASMGLRQVTLTREPVRHAKRHEALATAVGETLDHYERGGDWFGYRDFRPHHCIPMFCDRTEDHAATLIAFDASRVTTLRLVEA